MLAALAGAALAIGALLLLAGLFPRRPQLAARLAQFSEEGGVPVQVTGTSLLDTYGLILLETVKGEKFEDFTADVLVSGSDLETISREKVKAAGAGGAFLAVIALFFGWVSGPLGLLIVAALGATAGYSLPDLELKKKAAKRRVEFSRTLTAFMTLLSSSISGGGGLTTALTDAAAMGDGWVFTHIRQSLDQARLDGTSAWTALEQLGQRLQVIPLVELSASLTLAGTSGARVTETLVSRAQSSRERELSEVRSEAEAKSSKLGVPVGLIMMSWVLFVGFPAVRGLIGA